MKKLLSIIILSFLSYSLVQADDRVTKVEIIKTSKEQHDYNIANQ